MTDNPRFIAFADEHLGAKLYNIPELEQDNRSLFSQVVDTAIELKVDYLISVGDLFDDNEPTSELVDFVRSELVRLKQAGIKPLAICGDHSKAVHGVTWEKICGFENISDGHQSFVGVNYNDNPAVVLEELNNTLNSRPNNTVRFVFLHAQLPELWPFCDDKKKISMKDMDFSNHCESLVGLMLGDIHIRKETKFFDTNCDKQIFAGYCGSLGVTASNETNKEGLYYWNGETLNLIDYELPRKFVRIDVTEEYLQKVTEQDFAEYTGEANRPVFLCLLHGVNVAGRLDFLYEYGFVKMSRIKDDSALGAELINIRSELKTGDRITAVLKELVKPTSEPDMLYDALHRMLGTEDPKSVLDELKHKLLEPCTEQEI